MALLKFKLNDRKIDAVISVLLRTGVLASSIVVLTGGILYLAKYGNMTINYSVFHGEPGGLTSPAGIIQEVLSFSPGGIIQLGLLMLVATPVMRVIFTVFIFVFQKDKIYIVVALIVLALLIFSLISGML